MKKSIIIAVIILFVMPVVVFAGGSSSKCNTTYPIILAHGMGATGELPLGIDYWWGIVDALEDEGARVYVSSVNCMDSTRNKASQFKSNFLCYGCDCQLI